MDVYHILHGQTMEIKNNAQLPNDFSISQSLYIYPNHRPFRKILPDRFDAQDCLLNFGFRVIRYDLDCRTNGLRIDNQSAGRASRRIAAMEAISMFSTSDSSTHGKCSRK
jgi:hypothetical protein